MPSKKRTPGNRKKRSKQHASKSTAKILNRAIQQSGRPPPLIQPAEIDRARLTPPQVLTLQRAVGNQTVQGLLQSPTPDRALDRLAFGSTISRKDDKNTSGVVSNTLFDIWESNVQIAKNTFENAVKPAGPPPGKALFEAILAIGIDVTAARLFGPLIDAAVSGGQKALLEIAQGAYKEGVKATANAMKLVGDGKLKISPSDYANQWQNDQLRQINKGRSDLVAKMSDDKISESDVAALTAKVKGEVLSVQTAVQTLVQQYNHALYYKSGDDSWTADGLVNIHLAHGSPFNGNNTDLKEGKPFRCSVDIEGLDSKKLGLLAQSYPDGIDPVELGMAFRLHFYTFRDMGYGGNFKRTDRSLYFDNGANLDKGDETAEKLMQSWGGTVPIAKTWGSKKDVVGFSTKVL